MLKVASMLPLLGQERVRQGPMAVQRPSGKFYVFIVLMGCGTTTG